MWRARAVVLATAIAVLAACAGPQGAFPPLPDVGEVTTVPPIDRSREDLTGVVLPAVGGTTTTTAIAMGPGRSTLVGRVDTPTGPLTSGFVRLERLVGGAVAQEDVLIAPDGTWNRADLLGGRYRIRAFSVPAFAMIEPHIFFLEDGTHQLLLQVEEFGDYEVETVTAPDPPFVGERTNLLVRVASRRVDIDGVVRTTPRSGVKVALSGAGSWSVEGDSSGVTRDDGSAVFEVVCEQLGEQPLTALLDDGAAAVSLGLPACVDRPPPTSDTTDGTSTTRPDGSTTSSSSTTSASTTSTTAGR